MYYKKVLKEGSVLKWKETQETESMRFSWSCMGGGKDISKRFFGGGESSIFPLTKSNYRNKILSSFAWVWKNV
jgi:hypothetical protein